MYNNVSKLNKQCPNNTVSYVVKSGDTLYKIATRNKTSIEVLLELNPELNTNLLIPGIVMCVPVMMPEGSGSENGRTNCPTPGRSNCPDVTPPSTMPPTTMPPSTMPPTTMPPTTMPPSTTPPVAPIPPIMPMPPVVPPMEYECDGQMYTIRSGDTLYNLSRKYDITLYELLNANKNINPYNIQIGQVICIPIPKTKCPYGKVYTIAEGDTLEVILSRFGLSLSSLKETNKDFDPYNMRTGTVLCIPAFVPYEKCETERSYVIATGDNLTNISQRLMVSTTELLVLNPYLRPEDFQDVGMRICVPASATVNR